MLGVDFSVVLYRILVLFLNPVADLEIWFSASIVKKIKFVWQ
jgi:hypothetical protein